MTFADIERVTGTELPGKSQHSRAWWSNNASNNVMTKVWLDAGFESAEVDMKARKLVFKRVRHPLFGAMKGTFTIEPGYDLTSPMYTPEEWAEIEKEMEADWDQIEAGMKGMSETPRDYTPAEPEKPRGSHPAWGALKGTFWIDPAWDLTKSTMSDEELDELESNFDRTADRIAAGIDRNK